MSENEWIVLARPKLKPNLLQVLIADVSRLENDDDQWEIVILSLIEGLTLLKSHEFTTHRLFNNFAGPSRPLQQMPLSK